MKRLRNNRRTHVARGAAPESGARRREALAELGFTAAEIDGLAGQRLGFAANT